MAFNQGCRALVPRDSSVDPRYLSYALQSSSDKLAAAAQGTTFVELSSSGLAQIQIPWSNEEAQRTIADYLDHETAEIDSLVENLREFKDLLDETLHARRNELFRPFVGLDSSDLRGGLLERDERAGSTASPEDLLSVSIVGGVSRWADKGEVEAKSDSLGKYKRVLRNDLVLNRMRAFQGGIGVSRWDGITSPDYAVLAAQDGLLPEFAELLIKSERFLFEIRRRLRGIGGESSSQVRTPRISVTELVRIPVSLPSGTKQREVLDEWKTFSRYVAAETSDAERAITLAHERRAALISATVTGQIDVTQKHRPVAEQLEDEVRQLR